MLLLEPLSGCAGQIIDRMADCLRQAMIMTANDPPAPVHLQRLVPLVLDRLQQDDTGRLQAIRDAAKVDLRCRSMHCLGVQQPSPLTAAGTCERLCRAG